MASRVTTSQIGPLLVVVGETASGKSALSMDLALELTERWPDQACEIICADSRTVYKGMDIGTAKPTAEEQQRLPHHCIDLVTPDQPFTVVDYKTHAQQAIADIQARGGLPILVGGTGLYVDAILYDYTFRAPSDSATRTELNLLSVEELQKRLQDQGIPLPNNPQNPRHLVRALETGGAMPERQPLRDNTLVIGLAPERETLNSRIANRTEEMIAKGLEHEAKSLADRYGWDITPMQTIGYQEWQAYFAGTQSREQTIDLIIKNTMAYAKRQRTWFRRNKSIHWIDNRGDIAEIVELTTTLLNK